MKLSFIASVASIAAVTSAQTLADLPQCALNCLANAFPITGCSPTDLSCACSNALFVSGSVACIRRICPAAAQQGALTGAAALCRANGVSIPSTFPGSAPTPTATSTIGSAVTTTQATSTTTGRSTTRSAALPTATAFAGNATSNITTPTSVPGGISSGAERLTTALSLVGLSIAAAYFSL